MTQITATLSHPPAATVEPPAPFPQPPPVTPNPAVRDGPLRSGNPRGNPNLAPRCGAKARTTGCPCRAPAMPNGRRRMHGGKSTGPRTPQGLADLARAAPRTATTPRRHARSTATHGR
jgi:hypothetical protein